MIKWGQYDKKNWQQHREYYLPSFLCAWLVMGKVVSPTEFAWIVYWYTLRHCTLSVTKSARECLMFIFAQICVTIKWKRKKNGRKINIEKKVQIFCVFMCQSVSNGFLLKWNKHKTPVHTQKESALHAKGNAIFCMSQTYLLTYLVKHTLTADLSTKRLWLRWKANHHHQQTIKSSTNESEICFKTHEK